MTRVINLKSGDHYDVYIGRPSKWGNPFIMGRDGDRPDVIQKYREWIQTQPALLKDLPSLRGKILGCFCKPKMCHGDILVGLVAKLYERTE